MTVEKLKKKTFLQVFQNLVLCEVDYRCKAKARIEAHPLPLTVYVCNIPRFFWSFCAIGELLLSFGWFLFCCTLWRNISNTSASILPDTRKLMKARGVRPRAFIVFQTTQCWETPVKHEARVFEMASQSAPNCKEKKKRRQKNKRKQKSHKHVILPSFV